MKTNDTENNHKNEHVCTEGGGCDLENAPESSADQSANEVCDTQCSTDKNASPARGSGSKAMLIGAMISLTGLGLPTEVSAEQSAPTVTYNQVKIEGQNIFYREAGSKDAPTVLLLHGFPTSSHMFRNLIPQLAEKYHVVAPDMPGYGQSSAPSVKEFE